MQCPPPQDRATNPYPNPNPTPNSLQDKVEGMKKQLAPLPLEEGGKSKKSWKESSSVIIKAVETVKVTVEDLEDQLNTTSRYVNDYSFRSPLVTSK